MAGYFADFAKVKDLTPFRVTGRTQKAVWDSLGEYDLRSDLETLQLSAFVLHGEDDPIPVATAQDTAERLGAPIQLVANAGHCPYVEAFDEFVSAFDDFLPRR